MRPGFTTRDGFYMNGKSISRDFTDVYSVDFLVETDTYSWTCVSFDVFAEQGQFPRPALASSSDSKKIKAMPQLVISVHVRFRVTSAQSKASILLRNVLQNAIGINAVLDPLQNFLSTRVLDLRVERDVKFVRLVSSQFVDCLKGVSYATLS